MILGINSNFRQSLVAGFTDARRWVPGPLRYLPPAATVEALIAAMNLSYRHDAEGNEYLRQWLYGYGSFIKNNDPQWTKYMQSNTELVTTVKNSLLDEFKKPFQGIGAKREVKLQLSVKLHDEGGFMNTGYYWLNGSNNKEGGFRINGFITQSKPETFSGNLRFVFNDRADPYLDFFKDFRTATADAFGMMVGGVASQGLARNFRTSVAWSSNFLYSKSDHARDRGWPFEF